MLRAVDVVPFTTDAGEPMVALQDSTGIAHPVAVSQAGLFVLAHFDGTHTAEQVRDKFRSQFGAEIALSEIDGLTRSMDQALLLQNERYEQAYAARVSEYENAPYRDNRDRWPAADALAAEIDAVLAQTTSTSSSVDGIAGLIAPHLDYARGAPCYAAAYATLRDAPLATRYVILGTNHFGRSLSVVATDKDFYTPFGRVSTDRDFLQRLERQLGHTLTRCAFDHQTEHSIELHVHLLQRLHGDRPFTIVPLLCPDPSGATGTRPVDGYGPDLGEFADELAGLLREEESRSDEQTIVIASADLSHVGRRFGEEAPTTPTFLEGICEHDRALLASLEAGDFEQFRQQVADCQNYSRICSVGCLYTLARALPDHSCAITKYHQAVNFEQETHVTCAAGVLTR